jgi:hypothetical protein
MLSNSPLRCFRRSRSSLAHRSTSRGALIAATLVGAGLLVPSLARAAEISCPETRSDAHLATVSLYDGPPSEHADLMPDKAGATKSEWSVGYIFKAGRRLYIECKYGADVPAVVLEAQDVRACTFTSGKQQKALTCK